MKVIAVDMITGPIGAYGFRTGEWVATIEDGRKFKFFASIPHRLGLDEDYAIRLAQKTLDSKRHDDVIEWI